MSKIKFGVRIPFTGPASSPERLVVAAREAEALGFDGVLAQDHVHKTFERHPQSPMASGTLNDPTNTKDPVIYESLTTFAYLAGQTERLEFVTAVTPLPLREPIMLGKQLATVDALSGGRVIFGVGVANKTDKEEFQALNVPYLPYAERYELASEYVAAFREMWTKPQATYHGTHVNFDDITIYPKPARHLPVWIGCGTLAGGIERPAVRFAVEHADGAIPHAIMPPDTYREMIADFTETARAAGRDVSDFRWCAQRRISIGETLADANANVDWMKREQAEMWKFVGHLTDRKEGGTELSHTMATVGTPDDIRANFQRYVDAGATYFGIAFTYPTFEVFLKQMRLFAKEVMPAFK